MVTTEDGEPASKAVVKVSGHNKDIVTTNRGEWWRMLTPGDFIILDTCQCLSILINADILINSEIL